MTDILGLLGDEAEGLLDTSAGASQNPCCTCRGRTSWTGCDDGLDPPAGGVAGTSDPDRPWPSRRHRLSPILPVDQGVEHSGGASFAPNPLYFDPENIVRLAIEGGCNAVASTLGVLGFIGRRYAHRIPFLVKLNHNELLTYPAIHDQTLWASVEQAFDLGAVAVGATVYFGSPESRRQIQEIEPGLRRAHQLGLVTVLSGYLRNPAFKHEGVDYHEATDLTGQANHLAVTIEADIVKQKQATRDGGYTAIGFGKTHPRVYFPNSPATTPSTGFATRWPTATWGASA